MKWTCLDEPNLGNDDETLKLIIKPYNWLIDKKWIILWKLSSIQMKRLNDLHAIWIELKLNWIQFN
jgi:hypothetical protein